MALKRHPGVVGVVVVAVALAAVVAVLAAPVIGPLQAASPQPTCALMPIGTSRATVLKASVGAEVADILNSDRPGNRGWLTWTGDASEPVLAASLALPGDSGTYRNPDKPADDILSVGDWVRGRPGVVNSQAVRDALDALIGSQIVVPVWDATRGEGSGVAYHVSGFAKLSVTGYDLPNDNRIGARYLGSSDCAAGGLEAVDTSARTSEDNPVSIALTGRSPVPETLTFVLTSPAHGTAVLDGASSCTTAPVAGSAAACTVTAVYTPDPDTNGSDRFTFTVGHGADTSQPAAVTIDVSAVNDPPVTAPDSATGRQYAPVQITAAEVLANDRPGPANEADQTLTVTGVHTDGSSHGTATLSGGTIEYVPDDGFFGEATIGYTACDNGTTADQPDPRCSDGTIGMTIAEDRPPVAGPQDVTTPEDTPLPIVLAGSDPDADSLSFAVENQPSHGVLTGTAPNLTYTPERDFNGLDSFTFVANDGHRGSEPAKVAITVTEVNDRPTAKADMFAVGAGEPTDIPAQAALHNDMSGPANESGQKLRIAAAAATADTHGTVTVSGDAITYTPDRGYAGPASFTYTLCDDGTTDGRPDPLCVSDGLVTLTVVPPDRPPTADAQQLVTAEDTLSPVMLTGSDPDGDLITFSVVDGPSHGTLIGAAPVLTYVPAADFHGNDEFTFVTNDGRAQSEPAKVALRITEVNDPPVLGPDTATLGGAGTLPAPGGEPKCGTPCGVFWGDVHNITFDRATFDFQAVGEFVGVKSTTDDFELQIRTAPWATRRDVSIATAVAMRVNHHRVALYRKPSGTNVLIDGAPFTVPSTPAALPGGGTIGTYGTTNDIVVVWPDGSIAILTMDGGTSSAARYTVHLGLAPGRLGRMVGLLGNADGNKLNDVVTRDGSPLAFPPTFADEYPHYADSWRISQAESLFDYGPGETTETFTDRTFPDRPATAGGLPADVRAAAAMQCGLAGVVVPEVLDACTVDVALTGDADFASSSAAAQTTGFGVPANTGTTSIGTPTTVTIDTAGGTAVRSFTATAGQRVTLSVTGNTIPGADVTVRQPSGATVTTLFVSGATGFRDVFTLPVAGTYSVTVDPQDQNAGSLTFLLDAVPDDSTGQTSIGQPTLVTIATAGQNAVRSFTGAAGQRLTLSVSGNTIAGVDVIVRQPNGSTVASLFVSGGTGFRDVFTLPVAGTYTVTVDPPADNTGTLTFELDAVSDGSGTTSIGTPTTVTVATAGGTAARTFTASAGQRLTLTVTGNTIAGVDLTVTQPNGSTVTSLFVSGPTGFRDLFTLPVAGTYTITVDPQGTNTGSLTFTLNAVPDDETGTTSIGTPTTVTIGTAGQNASRTFTGTAGQKLTLTVTGNTIPGADLIVRQPSGSTVTSLFVSGATGFRDVFTLPVAGTYTITVDPSGQNTGSLTFTLATVPDNTGTTSIGTPTTVTIGTVGENAVRAFTGAAGQNLTLTVSGNTIPGADVIVRQPSGSTVTSLFVSGATGFRDVFTLPVAGTYTITVDPSGQNTGSLTFTLATVPDNTGTTSIGIPTAVTIGTPGENAVRSFDGAAAQHLSLTVTGNTIPGADLIVRQPSGSTVTSLFVSGATGFRDVLTLPVAGTYTITVDPSGQNTGSLTFTLNAVPDNTGTTSIGAPTAVTIGTPGENAVRSFDGAAGQNLTLSVTGNAIPGVTLTVRQPNGGTVATLSVSGATGFRDVFTLPVAGTYTITIDPTGQNTGSLTFTLNDVSSATPVHALIARETAPVTRSFASLPLAASQPATLTLSVASVLANDRPGPPNESDQTLTVTAVRVDAAGHGTVALFGGTITFNPDPGYVGPAVIVYTACDNGTTNGQPDPLCSDGTITVKVTANNPPTAAGQHLSTAEDVPLPVVLTGTDADGDALRYTVATAPAHGTLSGVAPNLTYTPAPDFHGADSFVFTTDDTHDLSPPATVDITVTEVNDAPTTQGDSVTAGVGQTVEVVAVDLARNDQPGPFDESAQTLRVTAVSATADTHGTVTLDGGTITYVPEAGFTATAAVGYTVCDDGATAGQPDPRCSDGRLSIVFDLPPTATPQQAATARNTPLDLTLTGSDPENDALTFTVTTPPANGTLTGTGPSRTYTPDAGFIGTDTFAFAVADGYSSSQPAIVSIEVSDTPPPTIRPDAAATAPNTSVLVDVLVNDTAGSGTIDPATLAVVAAPMHGTAVVESGAIRYTPAPDVTPDDQFTYRVCDTARRCGQAVVTISLTVPNRPPVAKADTYKVDAGKTLDVAAPGVLGNDSDLDPGDRLQAHLGTGVSAGNLLLRADGSFTYTPAAGFGGTDSFTYNVTDRAGLRSATVAVTIEVVPPGPLAVDDTYSTTRDNPLVVMPADGVLANDRDAHSSDILSAAVSRPAIHGAVAVAPDGSFVYTPDDGFTGDDSFRYIATDAPRLTSEPALVTIHVTAPTTPVPTVGAARPESGSRVTAPTSVTADISPPAGETIDRWTVTVRNLDNGTPSVLATGSGTPPSPITTFDPTTLVNGSYEILLAVTSSGGGKTTAVSDVVVAGEMKLGDYSTTYLDVDTTVGRFPVQVLRAYNTTDTRRGDFGPGWHVELSGFRATPNNRLGRGGWSTEPFGYPFTRFRFKTTIPHFVTITEPGGRTEVFDLVPAPSGPLLSLTTPAYVPRPGTGTTSKLEDVDLPTLALSGGTLAGYLSGDIYDPRLFRLTTADGHVLIIDRYDGLQSITDRNGNRLVVSADGVSSTGADPLRFVRDGAGRITEIRDPRGNSTHYTYSAAGDLVGVAYANDATQSLTYDQGHRLLTVKGGGRVVRSLRYDAAGRVTAVTDGNGNTSTIAVDRAARQEIFTDATGVLTTVDTYDEAGYLVQRDRAAGGKTITTKATYDADGRQLSSTDGLGHTTSQTYDSAGRVLTQTDANGHTTVKTYNEFGEPLTITDPLGAVTKNTYDANGNLIETDAADGGKTAYTYDGAGDLLTTSDPSGRVTSFTYDSSGLPLTVTDPGGHTSQRTFDENGRVASVTDAAGATTTFAYDDRGNLVRVTDANGQTRTTTYDAFNRVTSQTDATGAAVNEHYDAAGNLTSATNRDGQTIISAYDADSRLVSKNVPGVGITTYKYDGFGRRLSLENATARLTRTYDDADRIVTDTSTPTTPNALPVSTFTYTRDANGNLTSVQGPAGTTRYVYDVDSQLTRVTDPAAGSFNFGYDSNGRQTSMSRPNGIDDTTTYDAAGNLTSLHSVLGATVVNQADFTYNGAGLRATLTTTSGTASFGYDAAAQLVSATFPTANGLPDEQYTYDLVGNRTSSTRSPLGSFTYDRANRLLEDGSTTYRYDREGNLLSRTIKATGATTEYAWSAEHQLTSVTMPDGSETTYKYDPLGRRVEVDEAGAVTRYAYDGLRIAAEYDSSDILTAAYIHGPEATTSALEMIRGGLRYFYLDDAQQSTRALTTLAGTPAATYTYSAFGTPTEHGSLENPFTYTGQVYDRRAGLLLFALRAYDPESGRFISEDVVPARNPYVYASNSPINLIDLIGAAETTEEALTESRATYRANFLKKVKLPNAFQVHHGIPQKYADLVMQEYGVNVHSLQWLRGVYRPVHEVITGLWKSEAGSLVTAQDVLDFAAEIDEIFGPDFLFA